MRAPLPGPDRRGLAIGPYEPTRNGAPSLRKYEMAESAVMRPFFWIVRRHASIDIEKLAESETASTRCTFPFERGVGPYFECHPVRADTCERQRDRDIEIGRKADRRLARRSLKDAQRFKSAALTFCQPLTVFTHQRTSSVYAKRSRYGI